MKKRILVCVCILLIVGLCIFALGDVTVTLTGNTAEDGSGDTFDVTFTYKRIDPLLQLIHGTLFLQKQGASTCEEYKFFSDILVPPPNINYKSAKFWGFPSGGPGGIVFGDIYFDRDFKNFIIETDEKVIYAADKAFITYLRGIEGFSI